MKLNGAIIVLATTAWACQIAINCAQVVSHVDRVSTVKSFVTTYCLDCHGATEATAHLNLEGIEANAALGNVAWDTSVWEKIVKRLRSRQMPPADADRPAESEYEKNLAAMESILDDTAESFPHPGRTDPIRRLNRTEYQNAIRDLIDVDVDVENLLPADQSGHGFDNVTVGELPPILLNRYITAAEKISRLAVGGPQKSPGGRTVRLRADRSQETHVDGLPLGTRGGTVFSHQFPATGEYEIQLRLMRDRDENLEGLHEPHDIDVLLGKKLVHRFTVEPPTSEKGWRNDDDTLVDANLKIRFQASAGPQQVGITFPRKFSSIQEIKREPFDTNFNLHRHPRRTPALYEVSIVGPFDPKGPGETPSRRKIFTSVPTKLEESTACAEKILRRLMRLAYRRKVTEDDLAIPMRFFQQAFDATISEADDSSRSEGIVASTNSKFEAGIEAAIGVILVNPYFLFRVESTPYDPIAGQPAKVHQISNLELASRLSFFLWSSIPDDELLEAAESNRLQDPAVLRQEVMRMLKDERSHSLVNNFAAQWLYLRNLDSFQPDMRLFPDFDDNLRQALRRETELQFARVVREDRSVLELIRTDTTFLNERLAKHYNISHVFGSHFRPVQLDDGQTRRGGLLRNGSILAVTSYATRTSPTIRGSWILENILGTPLPPPPPNVPSLKENKSASTATIRERLAEHRANAACATCHDIMDPIGFALENFDALGRWRNFDQGQPIDSSGALPDGRVVSNIDELEAGILERPEMFVGTLTEKLMTFALGRGIEPYDGPTVRKVVRNAAPNDYPFSSLILGIVSSPPFQMRVSE